jgi:hypothetical protein
MGEFTSKSHYENRVLPTNEIWKRREFVWFEGIKKYSRTNPGMTTVDFKAQVPPWRGLQPYHKKKMRSPATKAEPAEKAFQ